MFRVFLIYLISINSGQPRTIRQQLEIIQSTGDHLGYANEPLTDIPYTAFLIDILHKFLRVSDLLVELLLDDLFRLDQFYANTKYSISTHKNVGALSEFLVKCKLQHFNEGSTSKEIRAYLKSYQGPQKKVLFEQINIQGLKNIFKKINNKCSITKLWNQYWTIHKKLRVNKETKFNFLIDFSSYFFENNCNNLLNLFLECYGKERITPYLHATCIHLHEMHKQHGNLNYYCNEGLEKLNDLSTHTFFRCTNKRATFIKQMLERDARLENEYLAL